jgi:ligand-binding sensor domain-containing protein/signal transduction histidine kinase
MSLPVFSVFLLPRLTCELIACRRSRLRICSREWNVGGFTGLLRILIFTVIILLQSPASAASVHQYGARLWQTDDGLPHNSVLAIAQTTDGYLWVGTQQGLSRFDGVRFVAVQGSKGPGFRSQSITALCASRSGALWIGTADRGLFVVRDGLLQPFENEHLLRTGSIKALLETRDGSLWVGTTNGLFQWNAGRLAQWTTNDGLAENLIRALYEDRDGVLWVATGNPGLSCFRDGAFVQQPLPKAVYGALRAICMDAQGSLWVGANSGLTCVNRREMETLQFTKTRGLPDNIVSVVHEDREGHLWVGTYGGLSRIANGKVIIEHNPRDEPFDPVYTMFEDREGTLWVGTKGGLSQLNLQPITAYTKQHGLTHNAVTSVYEDAAGTLWIGTWGGGLNWMEEEVIKGFPFVVSAPEYVLAIHEGPSKSLWFGSDYSIGMGRLRDGNLEMFRAEDGLVGSAVKVIHEDRRGDLWVGTGNGLNRLREGTFTRYTTENGLTGDSIQVIHEDRQGVLWFGTSRGLTRWQNERFDRFTTSGGLPHDSIGAIYEDSEGNLWLGTHGGGLCRMRQEAGDGRLESGDRIKDSQLLNSDSRLLSPSYSRFTTREGLFDDVIFEILEDDLGYFWMSCPKGIFRVARRDLDRLSRGEISQLACNTFGKRDGLDGAVCIGVAKPAGWKGRDGRLWFPTTKGIAAVSPDIKVNSEPPPVRIEEVIADKKVQSLTFDLQSQNDRTSATTLNFEPGTLKLPPGRGELEVHYTALSFRAPEMNRFKYRLEGLDTEWVDAGSRRFAYYNNLAPGDYTFHVMACNNDGVWNTQGLSLKVRLLPHFWQTGWFFGGCVAGLCGGVATTVRQLTRRKMKRQMALMEQRHALEKERGRIAQDMHDDLGARLTQITLLSDLAARDVTQPERVGVHVAQISETARDVVQAMDEIVWAVNPRNDTVPRLAGYILHYAEKFFRASSIRFRCPRAGALPNHPLSAEMRHHLFLVVKEALHNVVKHSEATEVWLRFDVAGAILDIRVEDNGRGVGAADANGERNGLLNMRQRMEKMGGQFLMTSEPGKGTKIQLRIQLG